MGGREGPRVPESDVIAAIATAPGKGGIGIVRISGRNISGLIAGILGRTLEPRRATFLPFLDGGGHALDEGLAIHFVGPASYTGEDTLELHGHGGPVVMQMILGRCLDLGARPARPGEFTQRAFLNDKLDLAQAEAVADLIDAATTVSARCAMRSLQGEFSSAVDLLVAKLIEVRMRVEAELDFPEEEIEPAHRDDVANRLEALGVEIDRAIDRGRRGSVLRNGLNVVIAGRPNMGKSSLLNALVGEDLAIVTALPGTTRDAIRQAINIAGVPLNIIDTAGLRETTEEVEAIGIGRTWEMIGLADVALLIVEAGVGIQAEDEAIFSRLPDKVVRVLVYNKVDLIGGHPSIKEEAGNAVLHLSAKTGAGLDLLRDVLLETAGWMPGSEDVFMARARHVDALARGSSHLSAASTEISRLEVCAEELRLAQQDLCEITGEFAADDLLGEIFSRFCIGK